MTPAVAVQLATSADAQSIAKLSRELIEHGLPWTWTASRVNQAILSKDTNVAIVRDQGSVAAFGIMEYLEEDAYLMLFAVRAARQRQGLGTTLLKWLEAAAVAAGSSRIRVDARRDNEAARNFYGELGYHEVRIRRHGYGEYIDQIRLEKWLRSAQHGDA